jgi:hypothetical protein
MQISVKIPVSKACTLDRIGRKGSKSLLSPHVFGARGSILGGASAGAEEASQSGMVLMSSPCAAALRCFVWMWLSSLPRSKRPASPAAKFQRPADKSRYQGGQALPGPGSHLARIFQNELFPSLSPARLNRATLAPPGTRTRSARTPVHRKSEERRGQLSPASWHAPMPAQPSSPSHHATSL